jgi:serine/threonine protein kinase
MRMSRQFKLPNEPSSSAAPKNVHTLAAGSKVGQGRFVLKRILGQGGMGMVWLAQDERLDELVALKFLPPQIRFDAVGLAGLRRETQRSRKLTHPHIIRIHDLHETEGEDASIAMEYVDGMTLTALRLMQPNEIFTWPALAPLVKQLCDALDYAHGEKVIHRDLKPANLMIDRHGRLKLADFGIASVISDSVSRISNQPISGTRAYMSPQQINGERPQATDDIYSFGVTLYELLTGTPPFYTGQILHQALHNKPPPPQERLAELGLENEIPADVEAMIMACLAKDPAQRPQSARAIADWIGLEAPPHPQSLAATLAPQEEEIQAQVEAAASRKKFRIVVVILMLLLLGAGGWLWATKSLLRKSHAPSVPAETVILADDFENSKADGASWWWDWEGRAGKSMMVENGNHFVRLEGNDAHPTRVVQMTLPVRAEWKKLAYSIRIRTRNLKINPAKQWSGAKLEATFLDGKKSVMRTQSAGILTHDTDWLTKTTWDIVPNGARYLRIDLTLYQASGIADFDDVKVTVLEQTTPTR